MLRTERAVVTATPCFKSNGTIAVAGLAIVLALSSLAGCAQAPATQADAVTRSSTAVATGTTTSAQNRPTCNKPEYPKDALRRGSQGTTVIRFLIETDGSVAQSTVVKSSGDVSLDEAARSALSKCRFNPAIKDDKPQRAWVPVQYVWSLAPVPKPQVPPTAASPR